MLAIVLVALMATGIISCSSVPTEKSPPSPKPASVPTVIADGNLTMPHQVKLRFGTPGTVKTIMVKEGDKVRAGTLLAKLDDTQQKLAIASAIYDVELALNELAEKVYPSILGFPNYYPSTSVIIRIEQALDGVKQATDLVNQGNPKDASAKLRLAQYDLEASSETLQTALNNYIPGSPNETTNYLTDEVLNYSGANIKDLIKSIDQDVKNQISVQSMLEKANYGAASAMLKMAYQELEITCNTAQKICGQVVLLGISYPDASTSLDSVRAAQERLAELQKGMDKGNYDAAELSKTLRMAQHDLAMSDTILKNNELIMKHGINLKLLRQHNLNLQKSRLALQQSKEDLMKTEILAPFDGTVVTIDVKENDQLSAYDYAAVTAVHLVDTKLVELEGVVDELDIFKVKTGQKATITVDALPGRNLTGTVTFISPYGADKTGVVNYKVIIKLDPTDLELKGGLTATANIIVDDK
jgi:multidrug efflux pump subunit AcrA (membrane-fusion protein)